jgi:ribonucleoside-diphosphate reductase alpha chain
VGIKIEYLEEAEMVYDITVEGNHNFFADDILVHNCTEISLHSNVDIENPENDLTFTCVLSSLNLSKWDEFKDSDVIEIATIFLDCVVSDFMDGGKTIDGLEASVRFTEKGRALGLGTLGFHTYLQQNQISFESFEAHSINNEIYSKLDADSKKASEWMAKEFGEPEWCEGYGVRNTHRIAIAPNMSSALMCGGVSQGIEPFYKCAFSQPSAAGEIERINPVLINLLREKGYDDKFIDELVLEIIENNGSISGMNHIFTPDEQSYMKTAFEIPQEAIVRLASTRQRWIDQSQSLNFFFYADASERYISKIHQMVFEDERLQSTYYVRSDSGERGSNGKKVDHFEVACTACAS